MSATDQQQVVESSGDQFLPGSTPAATAQPEPAPAATATEPASAAPAAPAPAATADAIDPLEAAIESSLAPPEVVTWGDDAKKAFASVFGADDPQAYKADIESRLQAAELLKSEYDKVAPLKDAFERFTPTLQRAFQLAMEGKTEEAQKYLRDVPEDVFLDREAKNIQSEKLLETYLPGKVSKDDFLAVKDPDTDPDTKAAIEAKIKHYREIAADMHERKRSEAVSATAERAAANQAQQEAWMRSTAEAIAFAQSDPVTKALMDDSVVAAFQTGNIMKPFVSEDGSSLSKESVSRYLWAIHGPKIAKAQYSVGYRKGKNEGSLETAQLQPGAPPTAGRATSVPPDTSENAVKEDIFSKLALMGR